MYVMMLGKVQGQASPAAAYVQHAQARSEAEFSRNVSALGLLCLLQIFAGIAKIATGIMHVVIKAGAKQRFV